MSNRLRIADRHLPPTCMRLCHAGKIVMCGRSECGSLEFAWPRLAAGIFSGTASRGRSRHHQPGDPSTVSREGKTTPRVRFRIRTIMLTIAAVAVILGVLRLMKPSIRLFLQMMPRSHALPLAVFAVVLFGSVVEFLVFWVYFHRRRKQPTRERRTLLTRRSPDTSQKVDRPGDDSAGTR
jgi:hypothetical protein